MKRLLLFVLSASVGLAQIPSDTVTGTLVQRATARRAFLAAHPNAREILRREDAIHFDADGIRTAIFQRDIAHVDSDSGEITPTDLDLVQTQAGYRTFGSPIVVRVVDGPLVGGNPTSMVQTFRKDPVDKTVMGYAIVTAPLTYQSDFRFTFQQQGVAWTLEVQDFGWDLRATVAVSQGAKTYRFGYNEVNMTLDPDADGNLAIPSGRYKITRPVMVRADGVTTQCGGWQTDRAGVRIAFTCDDSAFPAGAYPYTIDPTATFHVPASADDGTVKGTSTTWPPSAGSVTDTTTNPEYIHDTVYVDGRFWREQFLARWDTSSIPDTAVITGANLLYTYAGKQGGAECTIKADWVSPSIWPLDNSDYVVTQPGSAWSAGFDTITGNNTQQSSILAGANNTNISVNGYTAVRLGAYKSSQPTGWPICRLAVYSVEWPDVWPRPQLVVTYSNTPPQTVSATPNSGGILVDTWNTFTFQVSDGDGYADIPVYHLQVSSGPVGAPNVWDVNSCFLYVRPDVNLLYLRRDDNAEPWLGGYAFGSASFVENSQCKIDYANSTLTNSGSTSTAAVRMLLKRAFWQGGWTKHSYVYVADTAGASDGWDDYGSWTLIPGGPKLIVVQQ